MEWINTIRTWTDDPATDAMLLDVENEIVLHVVEEIEREIDSK